jgi:hypothetical protein
MGRRPWFQSAGRITDALSAAWLPTGAAFGDLEEITVT